MWGTLERDDNSGEHKHEQDFEQLWWELSRLVFVWFRGDRDNIERECELESTSPGEVGEVL